MKMQKVYPSMSVRDWRSGLDEAQGAMVLQGRTTLRRLLAINSD